jgi:hypothetical protein
MQEPTPAPKADAEAPTAPRLGRGGRPRHAPGTVRAETIGVRVTPAEHAALRAKAEALGTTPAQWLRQAALTRQLPPPPVPAINREEYAELARLSANLNQLARLANSGQPVVVADALLERLVCEVNRLRQALLGLDSDDR